MTKLNVYKRSVVKDVLVMLACFLFVCVVFVWQCLWSKQPDTSLSIFIITLFISFGCYGVAICLTNLEMLDEKLKEIAA